MTDVRVDGIRYVPEGARQSGSIGIGITTKDRRETFNATYAEIERLAPPGARIVVVDDASKEPLDSADFRFDSTAGIARAKNKCLELLAECDHIFLFDDDCYPVRDDWWQPYVESPEPHLMWFFLKPQGEIGGPEVTELYRDSKHVAYHATRGCVLYVERHVLDVVGGMDPGFGQWGWEHASWSDRIHSAGLTTWRYAAPVGVEDAFVSLDQRKQVESTATAEARKHSETDGYALRMASRHDPRYIEFRETRHIVMTSLLTKHKDPQRGSVLKADVSALAALHKSLGGENLVVLHTSMDNPSLENTEFVQVEQSINPYFERHLQSYQYLRAHPEVDYVWCVDGTDVQMLRNPFDEMERDTLYLGYEPKTLRDKWMLANHPDATLQGFMQDNPNLPLLNAGLIGGPRKLVMRFLHEIVKFYFDDHIDWLMGWETRRVGVGDMAALNYIARTKFSNYISSGPHVCTIFKGEEKDNKTAWWKHK